jgi:prevent-host-death family protein
MKRAKVSELKARLSSYLAEVKKGDEVIVCERTVPIARLVPIAEGNAETLHIIEPDMSIGELEIRPVPLAREIDVDQILKDTRGH